MYKGHSIFLSCCYNDSLYMPPFRSQGPYACAHYLEQHGYDCDVLDFFELLTTSQLVHVVSKLIRPDTIFIGISTTFLKVGKSQGTLIYTDGVENHADDVNFTYLDNLINAIYILKQKFKDIKFVIGGAKASFLGHSLFDCAIHGFGEDLILEYADYLIGKNPFLKYSYDPKWPNMMVIKTANKPKFDITSSNFKFQKKHCILPDEPLPLTISRGCIFKCKFCGYPQTGKRKGEFVRSIDCIIDEVKHNYQCFGTTAYWFNDETFNDDTDKLKLLAEEFSKLNFKIQFTAYIRVDLLRAHKEQIELLEAIGIKTCLFGIETFSKQAGQIIGKGLTGGPLKEFLLELKENWDSKEITFHNNFIVGLPGDTIESQYETQQWHIDNKMRDWYFLPLKILSPKYHKGKLWLSDFEKNSEKYGFKFPIADPHYWENSYTNWTEVNKISRNLAAGLRHITLSAEWTWAGLYNLGYKELNDQNQFSRYDWFNSNILKEKTSQRVQEYFKLFCTQHNINYGDLVNA